MTKPGKKGGGREKKEGGKERKEGGRERKEGRREKREGGKEREGGMTATAGDGATGRKPSKHKGGGTYRTVKPDKAGAGGMPIHYVVLPALLLGGVAVLVYFGEQWFLGPAVNRPLLLPPAVSEEWRNDSVYLTRLWGTYRSNIYFGVRPRVPKSLMAGIMWYTYDKPGQLNIRHTCEHGDQLPQYGWIRHDGTGFGQQRIVDHNMIIETDFLTMANASLGETWTVRIRGKPRQPLSQRPVLASLIVYLYNEGRGEMAYHLSGQRSVEEVYGHTPEFRQFRMYLPRKTVATEAHHSFLSTRLPSIAELSSYIRSVMKEERGPPSWPPLASLPGEVRPEDGSKLKPNLVAYQVTTTVPFELDIVMETGLFSTVMSVSGERLSYALDKRQRTFDQRFESTFKLTEKGFSDAEVVFAKAAFSNLVGGMAYFYGQSKVTARGLTEPLDYWPTELYTAVPSRSFFPRGFLWDEGFHQLLTAHWDTSITKDVLAHWLDMLNSEGWIPREQILGEEARSKVPAEFVVQHNENANPPTFFITMETLLSRMEEEGRVDVAFLSHVYPRLQVWFSWFNTTQSGERPLTYRWRGRNGTTDRELNPKTLTSGLDDFPRSSHPSPSEHHVDLYCWMALASGVMARIADILGKDSTSYWSTHHSLSDPHTLDSLHWDRQRKTYSDYGLHTSAVKLVRVTPPSPHQPPFKRRKVTKEPVYKFVNSFGYVQLFPFLLKMVPPSSQKLGIILTRLRNTSLLWTDYGLRSLARNDPFYNKFNTEHDPPYWRGAIWINMNYLAVRALHHYGNTDGPYRSQAASLYQQLRSNLISNMARQYEISGYVWEQYEDKTGRGKGTHPFTGWSSLIVLIMAEKY